MILAVLVDEIAGGWRYDADRIEDMRRLIDAPNSDIFDVLAYVRFTLAPLTRSQRAEAARSTGLSGYEPEMRENRPEM